MRSTIRSGRHQLRRRLDHRGYELFSDPHGLLKLQTFTDTLSAGSHTIIFEVGDVNDHLLDSAAFISNLRGAADEIGTTSDVPEEGSVLLVGIGLAGVIGALWRRRAT